MVARRDTCQAGTEAPSTTPTMTSSNGSHSLNELITGVEFIGPRSRMTFFSQLGTTVIACSSYALSQQSGKRPHVRLLNHCVVRAANHMGVDREGRQALPYGNRIVAVCIAPSRI